MMQLAICFASLPLVPIHWVYALLMLRFPKPWKPFVDSQPDLAASRNYLVKKALEWGAKKILFIDTDTIPFVWRNGKLSFDPNVIRLMMENDAEIVVAPYMLKDGRWSVFERVGDTFRPMRKLELGKQIELTGGAGLGYTLFDSRVFEELDPPWFEWKTEKQKYIVAGEDVPFFERAREAGFKVIVDGRIVCKHIVPLVVMPKGELGGMKAETFVGLLSSVG